MSQHEPGTVLSIRIPLIKSLTDMDTGKVRHAGIASDESEDVEGDVIGHAALAKSFDYLTKHGKHNLNHNHDDIGDVLRVGPIQPAAAKAKYDAVISGVGTEIEGDLYPVLGQYDPPDLLTAHHRLRAKARMGYSLDGLVSRSKEGQVLSVFVPKVAICTNPVNASTTCRMVKSIGGAMEALGVSDADFPHILEDMHATPDVVVEYDTPDGVVRDTEHSIITKALQGALMRAAFGRHDPPKPGNIWQALAAQSQPPRDALSEAILNLRRRS